MIMDHDGIRTDDDEHNDENDDGDGDDENDIDWVDENDVCDNINNDAAGNTTIVDNIHSISTTTTTNEKDQTIHIVITDKKSNNGSNSSSSKKKGIKKLEFNDNDYELCLKRYQEDVMDIINRYMNIIYASCHQEIIQHMLSQLPSHIHNKYNYNNDTHQHLSAIISWFDNSYKLLPNQLVTTEEGRDGCEDTYDLLHHIIKHKVGSRNQLCQLLYALLIGLRYHVRIVFTIDPCSFMPIDHIDIYEERLIEQYSKQNEQYSKQRNQQQQQQQQQNLEASTQLITISDNDKEDIRKRLSKKRKQTTNRNESTGI